MQVYLQRCKSIIFADDTTIYATNKSLNQLVNHMTYDLSIIKDWFRANKLTLNLSKTAFILFKPNKRQNPDVDLNMQFIFDNQIIKLSKH